MLFSKAALFAVVTVAPATSLHAFAKRINEDLPEDAEEFIYTRELKKGKSDSGKGSKSSKSGGTCPNAVCDIPMFPPPGYDRKLQSDKQPRSLDYDSYYGRGRYAPPSSPIDVSCCKEFIFEPGIEWQCNGLTDEYIAVSQIISSKGGKSGKSSGPESKMWCCKKDCSALEQGNCFIPYGITLPPFEGNPLCGGIPKGSKGGKSGKSSSKSSFEDDDAEDDTTTRRGRRALKKQQEEAAAIPELSARKLGKSGKSGCSSPVAGGLCNDVPPPPGFAPGPYTEVAIEGLPDCSMRIACCAGGVVGSEGPSPFDMLASGNYDDYGYADDDDGCGGSDDIYPVEDDVY